MLVVDDEAPVRDIVGQYLARDGFRVVATGDGREVTGLVEREAPHLVVLDVMLRASAASSCAARSAPAGRSR